MKTHTLRTAALLLASGAIALSACGGAAATPAPVATTAAPAATSVPAAVATTAAVATSAPAATAVSKPAATTVPAATVAPKPAVATTAPTAAPAPTTAAKPAAAAAFKIDQTQSQASFTLNERLFGQPKTVVGTTSKVDGTIEVDWANLSNSKIGPIQIDARDFRTDSGQRNGAIQRFILQSDQSQFQFITFTPTKIEGLPAKVDVGQAATFKVTGDLKIRTITKPVTWDVTVTATSANELSGSAKTQVMRTAFDLQIPSVPSVADVTDEVALELKFVAKP